MKAIKTPPETLDLGKLKPHLKSFALIKWFDSLKPGESFIFENDQDPVGLYHLLLGERLTPFGWIRLKDGPDTWRVKVSKPQPELQGLTIGELATLDYKNAEVFQKLGINYCCGGRKSLKEACEEAGVKEDILEEFLQETSYYKGKEVYAFDKWELDFLTDYIIRTHHGYVKQTIPSLLELSAVVVKHNEKNLPELKELAERLNYFLSGLLDHLEKEEQLLFPQIKKLEGYKKKNRRAVNPITPGIGNTIRRLEKEHALAGEGLKFFKKLTKNYQLPAQACDSCTHLYAKLLEFENDLVQHIHLENNILFPKAIVLEKELVNSTPKAFVKQISKIS